MVIPNARLKFFRRVKAVRDSEGKDLDAGRIVHAILHLWQLKAFPKLISSRAPWGTASYIKNPAVQELASWASGEAFGDAAYWIATVYALLVDKSVRAEQALFFTPPLLADRVISNLEGAGASLQECTWHDPACGGSAFLVPLAVRMMKELGTTKLTAKEKLTLIERSISGNDVDAELLYLSTSLLRMAVYPLIEQCRRVPDFNLSLADGLDSNSSGSKFDVVVCNPPYRKLGAEEVDLYRPSYGQIIEGQPNIYGLFFMRCLEIAKKGGLVGLLTPTSFLSGNSFSLLRTNLLANADVLSIDMLGNRKAMFIDVLQETAITLLKPREVRDVGGEANTQISVLSETGEYSKVGTFPLPSEGRPWPIPRTESDAALVALAESHRFTLSDYGYEARIGHLVAYRDKRRRFATFPAKPGSRLVIPLVWATDIAPDGKFEHGRQHRTRKSRAFVQIKSLKDSGVIRSRAVLLQRLTSSDQRSRLVVAPIPRDWLETHGAFICENHVIVLEPTSAAKVDVDSLAKLLGTSVVDRVFRTISSATNVAVSELEALLLPDPKVWIEVSAGAIDLNHAARQAYEKPNLAKSSRERK